MLDLMPGLKLSYSIMKKPGESKKRPRGAWMSRALGGALLATCVLAATSAADDYYVSLTGEDGSSITGAGSSPWRTVAYAATRATAGDTIHIGTGAFDETEQTELPSGVSLKGDGVDNTVLSSGMDRAMIVLSGGDGAGQVLSDFKIDGESRALRYGISINRSNVVLTQLSLENINTSGIYVNPSATLNNVTISSCNLRNCAKWDGSQHTGAIWINKLDHSQLYDNTIYESDGYGIKGVSGLFRNCSFYRNDIEVHLADIQTGWCPFGIEIWGTSENNEVYENNLVGCGISLTRDGPKGSADRTIVMHHNTVDLRGAWSTAFEIHGNTDVEFYNNFVIHPYAAGAFLVMDDGNNFNENIYIHHNTIINDPIVANRDSRGQMGIWFVAGSINTRNVFVYNNTLHDVEGIQFGSGTVESIAITNNVFMSWQPGVKYTNGTTTGLQLTNNVFWGNGGGIDGGPPSDSDIRDNFTNQDPELRMSGDLATEYYTPSGATSFVVDEGVDVQLPYLGTAPDIGAFEHIPPTIGASRPLGASTRQDMTKRAPHTLVQYGLSQLSGNAMYYSVLGQSIRENSTARNRAMILVKGRRVHGADGAPGSKW